jgi:predicted DNA-binding antitoxin AbrB/MazE fold protein
MSLTVVAIYEHGALKPVRPLPLIPEGARVWVTLHVAAEEDRVHKAYGLLGWTGDAETVRRVALAPGSTPWAAHDLQQASRERQRTPWYHDSCPHRPAEDSR